MNMQELCHMLYAIMTNDPKLLQQNCVMGSTRMQSTVSNLKQVANVLCALANSASYPQWDGK